MQWNELAWTDADGNTCRLSAQQDSRYLLAIGDQTITIAGQQALQDLHRAIDLLQADSIHSLVAPTSTPKTIQPTPVPRTASVDPTFPTKIRNAILLMVSIAIVILSIDAIRLAS
jgi:hypothetical protein